jgi:hypothetical protein
MKPCEVWAPEISVAKPAALLVTGLLLQTAGLAVTAASVKDNGLRLGLRKIVGRLKPANSKQLSWDKSNAKRQIIFGYCHCVLRHTEPGTQQFEKGRLFGQ